MKRYAKWMTVCLVVALAVSLTGCMYGGEVRKETAPATGEYIAVVQGAVDRYHQEKGVLPIKNKEMDTPIYEKYVIDFKKLQEWGMLQTVPTNAFESGGTALYVLINPETKPEVKLLDLSTYQAVVALQKEADAYREKHAGQIAKGEQVAPHFYLLDFGKLKLKSEQMRSPYSRSYLSVLIHDSGTLAIDYGPEIAKAMGKLGMKEADAGVDLRTVLVQSGIFVPARSYPYRWIGGQPTVSEN